MGRVGGSERLTPAHPPPTPPPEAEGDGVKGWKRAGLMHQLRGQSPFSNRKEEKFSLGSVIGQKKEIKSIQTGKEDPSCHCVWMSSSRRDAPQPHKKQLEIVSELKVPGYNPSNLGLSLYANSELSDIELYHL